MTMLRRALSVTFLAVTRVTLPAKLLRYIYFLPCNALTLRFLGLRVGRLSFWRLRATRHRNFCANRRCDYAIADEITAIIKNFLNERVSASLALFGCHSRRLVGFAPASVETRALEYGRPVALGC